MFHPRLPIIYICYSSTYYRFLLRYNWGLWHYFTASKNHLVSLLRFPFLGRVSVFLITGTKCTFLEYASLDFHLCWGFIFLLLIPLSSFPWLSLWSLWLCRTFRTFSDILLSKFTELYHRPFWSRSMSWLHFPPCFNLFEGVLIYTIGLLFLSVFPEIIRGIQLSHMFFLSVQLGFSTS